MNAQKQPFLTRRKFEKNGLCQNSTDGALQAWSLLFLCRVLLESQAQAISAQKHPFCLELAFPMGEQGTLLAVIALIVAVVGIFLPIPLTLMRSAGCERSLRRMISAVSSAWRMASEGLWKRLAADRKIEVAIVSGVRFVTKLERHPNMALVQGTGMHTTHSAEHIARCNALHAVVFPAPSSAIGGYRKPDVRATLGASGRYEHDGQAQKSQQKNVEILGMGPGSFASAWFVEARRPLDVSSDPDRCSEFDRRKFAVGSGALCLSQGSCKRKCSERADCHHVQTYVNEEVCYLKPLACEAEDHWYADQEYFAFVKSERTVGCSEQPLSIPPSTLATTAAPVTQPDGEELAPDSARARAQRVLGLLLLGPAGEARQEHGATRHGGVCEPLLGHHMRFRTNGFTGDSARECYLHDVRRATCEGRSGWPSTKLLHAACEGSIAREAGRSEGDST
ncbi:unnamed protein product [Symbiodinium microadriaticum]|nr:unnamed protein product [Symbiodinium microadriaticum]